MRNLLFAIVFGLGLMVSGCTDYYKNVKGYPQSTVQYHYNQDHAECLRESYAVVPNQIQYGGGDDAGKVIAAMNAIDSGNTDQARRDIYSACMAKKGWYRVASPK